MDRIDDLDERGPFLSRSPISFAIEIPPIYGIASNIGTRSTLSCPSVTPVRDLHRTVWSV